MIEIDPFLLEEVATAYGKCSMRLLRPLGGYSSMNFLVEADGARYVVKLRKVTSTESREEQYGELFVRSGIPWPPFIRTTAGERCLTKDTSALYLMPFVEGRTLHSSTLTKGALRSTAQLARSIHSLPPQGGSTLKNDLGNLIREVEKSSCADKESCLSLLRLKEKFTTTLASQLFPETLIHGDLHGENILVDVHDRVCAVLDLELTGPGTRGYDLFSFISITCCTNEFTPDNCRFAGALLHEYFGGMDHIRERVEECLGAYLQRWATECFFERVALSGQEWGVPFIKRDLRKFQILSSNTHSIVDLLVEGIDQEREELEQMIPGLRTRG